MPLATLATLPTVATLATPNVASAQGGRAPAPGSVAWTTTTLTTLATPAEDRTRLGHLLGRDSTAGFLLRSPRLGPLPEAGPSGAAAGILPEVLLVHNSDIPSADNDGALWAGRGASVLVRGGLAARIGRVTVVLAPEVAHSRNAGFASTPALLSGQRPFTGPFAPPWFAGPYAIDLPIRFGDQSYTVLGFGQSSVTYGAGRVAFGASTENQWWGPGVRNALLLSNAGEGFPHAFVRTARPLRTRLGDVEARWFLGTPTRSLFAAADAAAERGRVLNGAAATLALRSAPGLTVGLARLVLSSERTFGGGLGRALDVLVRHDNLGTGDTLRTDLKSDQLASAFARYVVPGARAEVYGEFARLELPRTLRDFLTAPLNTGAYTLGLAHAWAGPRAGTFRAGLEVSNLEQSRTFTDRPPPPDFYTGRAAPAGFTTRGQPLGAAIGPGSQSQWAALDYFARRWDAGLFAQRVRHQNDALYRVPAPNTFRNDVSLAGGFRGGVRAAGVDARATLTATRRLNYLFQNGTFNYLGIGSVDVHNLTLAVSLAPTGRAHARPPR